MNREDFSMLDGNLVYFDNGATTLKPKCVVDSMNRYCNNHTSNIHRGDYDAAIVGVSSDDRVIYDYDEMIACLMIEDDMTMEEAMDFIDYNTLRAIPYAGENAPIVMYKFNQ